MGFDNDVEQSESRPIMKGAYEVPAHGGPPASAAGHHSAVVQQTALGPEEHGGGVTEPASSVDAHVYDAWPEPQAPASACASNMHVQPGACIS